MILFLSENCTHTTFYLMGGPRPCISTFDIYAMFWDGVDRFVHVTREVITTAFWLLGCFLICVFSLFPKADFKKLKSLIHWTMFTFPDRKCGVISGTSMIFHALSLSEYTCLVFFQIHIFQTFLRSSFPWM